MAEEVAENGWSRLYRKAQLSRLHVVDHNISALLRAAASAASHQPRLIRCEICNGVRLQVRTGPGSRIGYRCLGCRRTGHHRAAFAVIRDLFGNNLERLRAAAVYEISSHGTLHAALKRHSTHSGFSFVDSGYFQDIPTGQLHKGIRCENVERLSFADQSFDLVTSTGLMEHVENDERGFAEISRVLKAGGYTVFTVPVSSQKRTQVRAVRGAHGKIEHLLPPEYHSDPWHVNGVFTWRNYGYDIVDMMARVNLAAEIRHVAVDGLATKMPIIVARRSE